MRVTTIIIPKKVIANYVKFIKKFKTKEISLISYDNFDLKKYDLIRLSGTKIRYNKKIRKIIINIKKKKKA